MAVQARPQNVHGLKVGDLFKCGPERLGNPAFVNGIVMSKSEGWLDGPVAPTMIIGVLDRAVVPG